MKTAIANIIRWSKDRHIIPNSTANAQLIKCLHECHELGLFVTLPQQEFYRKCNIKSPADAQTYVVDAVGDICVCLINVAELYSANLSEKVFEIVHTLQAAANKCVDAGIIEPQIQKRTTTTCYTMWQI